MKIGAWCWYEGFIGHGQTPAEMEASVMKSSTAEMWDQWQQKESPFKCLTKAEHVTLRSNGRRMDDIGVGLNCNCALKLNLHNIFHFSMCLLNVWPDDSLTHFLGAVWEIYHGLALSIMVHIHTLYIEVMTSVAVTRETRGVAGISGLVGGRGQIACRCCFGGPPAYLTRGCGT